VSLPSTYPDKATQSISFQHTNGIVYARPCQTRGTSLPIVEVKLDNVDQGFWRESRYGSSSISEFERVISLFLSFPAENAIKTTARRL